jgi:long-chain fatty acid transport protein
MGGVAVANPQSPSSALYWNPATMTGFDRSELDFGIEFLLLDTHLSSQFPAGSRAPDVPPVGLSGRTISNSSAFPLPNAGLVYRPEESPLTFGLGLNAVAGFGVDYPGSTTNPILSARQPFGVGVGPVFSNYQVLQISPSVAYQVTDRLTVAAAPNLDIGFLQFSPGLFLTPDINNGLATYPPATGARTSWGAGVTVGLYYQADTWATGVSYKSPQWFEPYRYNTADVNGVGRAASVNLDLPMILSWGVAYTGFERWVLAADVRYLGFHEARGFEPSGFAPNGAATGLGFKDVFAAALGVQYRVTDRLTIRGGYSYSTDPIPNARSLFNIASPTIIQHTLSVGGSWAITDSLSLSGAYLHGFRNSIAGPLQTGQGAVPGTSVGSSTAFDSIVFGASVKFGPSRAAQACAVTPSE